MKVTTIYAKTALPTNVIANLCNLSPHAVNTVKFVVGFPDHDEYMTGGGRFSIHALSESLNMLFSGTMPPEFSLICIAAGATKVDKMPPYEVLKFDKKEGKNKIIGYVTMPIYIDENNDGFSPKESEVHLTNLAKMLEYLEKMENKEMIEVLFDLPYHSPIMYVSGHRVRTFGPWRYTEKINGEPVIYL